MAQACDSCGKSVYQTKFMLQSKRWLGVDCGCFKEAVARSPFNPWSDLRLNHVHDEGGNPIRVTSIHQLREAEKRYQFTHHVANSQEANFDRPKQQKTYSVADLYRRKFAGR